MSDHKPLGNDSPQKPDNCAHQYNATIAYSPGNEMKLTDALLRLPNIQHSEVPLDLHVDHITLFYNVCAESAAIKEKFLHTFFTILLLFLLKLYTVFNLIILMKHHWIFGKYLLLLHCGLSVDLSVFFTEK